jgi:hypothetical protein
MRFMKRLDEMIIIAKLNIAILRIVSFEIDDV